MTTTVPVSAIKDATKAALGEAFDTVVGMFLDKGDSLWETLENVTAEQASVPISANGNSIAAQVEHMNYYFGIMEIYTQGEQPTDVNWAKAWEVGEVSDAQWNAIKQALKERQSNLFGLIDSAPEELFADPDIVGGTYAIVAHTAFHLGQIRHALAAQGL